MQAARVIHIGSVEKPVLSDTRPPVLTLVKAAEYLGRSIESVRGLIKRKRIRTVERNGDRRVYIELHELNRFLLEGQCLSSE